MVMKKGLEGSFFSLSVLYDTFTQKIDGWVVRNPLFEAGTRT